MRTNLRAGLAGFHSITIIFSVANISYPPVSFLAFFFLIPFLNSSTRCTSSPPFCFLHDQPSPLDCGRHLPPHMPFFVSTSRLEPLTPTEPELSQTNSSSTPGCSTGGHRFLKRPATDTHDTRANDHSPSHPFFLACQEQLIHQTFVFLLRQLHSDTHPTSLHRFTHFIPIQLLGILRVGQNGCHQSLCPKLQRCLVDPNFCNSSSLIQGVEHPFLASN